MIKTSLSWFRALLIISTLLLSQFSLVLASDTPTSPAQSAAQPASDSMSVQAEAQPYSDPERPAFFPEPVKGCAVGVNGFALAEGASLPANTPLATQSPPYYGIPPALVEDPATRSAGDMVSWVVILTNTTATSSNPECTVIGAENLSNLIVTIEAPGLGSIDLPVNVQLPSGVFDPSGVLQPGGLGWALITIPVPTTSGSSFNIISGVSADDSVDDIPSSPDVVDSDTDPISIVGPAFSVFSFAPDLPAPASAAPGQTVGFTLIIENTRSDVITDISVSSPILQFQNACTGIGEWTVVGGGATITQLALGERAQCVIDNVVIPESSGLDSFVLTGTVTVSDAGIPPLTYEDGVASGSINILQPSVAVEKSVLSVTRAGQPISVTGPAQTGDTVIYQIVITNNGDMTLDNFSVNDTLTGPVVIPPTEQLAPGGVWSYSTNPYTILSGAEDPLTNTVQVQGRAVGTSITVSAQAVATLDLIDSALQVTLITTDLAGIPITSALPGTTIQYELRLRNLGQASITGLSYVAQTYPLVTIGTPPNPINPSSLGPGGEIVLTWQHTVLQPDPLDHQAGDPLVSTIRVRGQTQQGALVYATAQATLNVDNPSVNITADVTDPINGAVLRGGNAEYHVTVTAGPVDLCNVTVNVYRRDPDTGLETLIAPDILGLTDFIDVAQNVQTDITYQVTGSDKDPLYMVFEVTSTDCTSGATLSDRTARLLDITDAQVNALLDPVLGADDKAMVGETIRFDFYGQNTGPITLTNVWVEYCILSLPAGVEPDCAAPQNQFTLTWPNASFPGRLRPFETTSSSFQYTVRPEDLAASSIVAMATLHGKDNEGKDVVIRTSAVVPISSGDLTMILYGPADGDAVIGDTETFSFYVRNESGVTLNDIKIYNWTDDWTANAISDPVGHYQVLATIPTLGVSGEVSGTFTYAIHPDHGIDEQQTMLTLEGRVTATKAGVPTSSSATLAVALSPILEVKKTGTAFQIAGGAVTYNVEIINHADTQTVDITSYADDVLTQYGVSVAHANFTGWITGQTGILQPEGQTGSTVTGSFTITSVSDAVSPLTNTFTVTGTRSFDDGIVVATGTHSTTIDCPLWISAIITNEDAPDADYVLGEWLHWRITVQNISDRTITGITIEDTLFWQGSVPFVAWPGASGTLTPGQIVTIGNPGDPNPSARRRITAEDYLASAENAMNDTFTITSIPYCKPQIRGVSLGSPIVVTKLADPLVAFTGDPVEYTIHMINVTEMTDSTAGGDYRYYFVTVNDTLLGSPLTFQYNGPSSPAGVAGQLGPGEEVTTTVIRNVQANDPEELTNVATAIFNDPVDTDVTYYYSDEVTVFTGSPVQIVKTPSQPVASAGDTISYDYVISNVSPYIISNLTLVDDKLGDIVPALTGGTITLQENQSQSILDVPYTIPLDALDPLTNIATATYTVTLPDSSTRELTYAVTATVDLNDPKLIITKTAVDSASGNPLEDLLPTGNPDGIPEADNGGSVDYCFTVTNQNLNPAETFTSITVEDLALGAAVQTAFTAAVATKYPSHPSNQLNGSEFVTFCIPDQVLDRNVHGDPVVNTVTITGVSTTGATVENEGTYTIDLVGTDLVVTKTPSSPVAYVGQEIQYTIRLWNRRPGMTILDLTVTDAFGTGVPVEIPLTDFNWAGANLAGVCCYLETDGVAFYTYTYTIQNTDPDPLVNTVSVLGHLDDNPTPALRTEVADGASASVAVTASQLLVRKTATPSIVNAGETVTYTITVTNIGSLPVHNLTVSDTRYDVAHGVGALTALLTDTDLNPYESAFATYTMDMPTAAQIIAAPANQPLDPYINTVTAQGSVITSLGNATVTADATESVDILMPNIRITKSANQEAATPGENVTYAVTITNIGDETINQLTLRDVTANLLVDISSASSTFQYMDAAMPYNEGHGLRPNEVLIGTVTVTVPTNFVGTEFTNVVEVNGFLPSSAPIEDSSSATIDIRDEGITVEKTASITSGIIGALVQYTLRITNVGGVPIDRVVISDAGMSGGSITISGANAFDGPGADDASLLEPDEEFIYQYTHTLSVADGDPYINTARVTARTTGPVPVQVTAQAQSTVDVQMADVAVEKFACVGTDTDADPTNNTPPCQLYFRRGQDTVITYYLHIYNPNAIALQNVQVSDSLVDATTFDTITWPGAVRELAANDGTPNTGPDEVWFAYQYTVIPTDPDPLVNLVTVAADSTAAPTVRDTDSAQVDLVAGDLLLTKTVNPAQAQVGETVTYTFTVQNLGALPLTTAQIVDPMLTGGSAPVTGCTWAQLTVGSPAQTCTATHVVALGDASPLNNTATATAFVNGTAAQISDTATATLSIVGASGLRVTKTADRAVAAVGDTITYTYEIENTGTIPITNLSVTDTDPGAVFAPSAWPQLLGAGEVQVRTATHVVQATDLDPYINTLTVTGTAGTEAVMAEASASVAISSSALTVSNTPNQTYVVAGLPVTFTYVVSNLGSTDLTTLTVTDGLCNASLATQLAASLTGGTLLQGHTVTLYCTIPGAQVTAPGPIISTVTATANDGIDILTDSATAQVDVTTGGIVVEKTADLAVAAAGDTIHYTVTVTNISTATLSNFTVNDPIVVLSPAPPASLAAGASFTMTGQYLVPGTGTPDSVANTVVVTATDAANTVYTDSAAASVGILEDPNSAVMLTKETTQASVLPGGSVDYTFRVRNLTNQPLADAQILISDDALTSNLIPVPAIGPNNEAIVHATGTVPDNVNAPLFVNTALAVDTVGGGTDQASASILVELLSLDKQVAGITVAGSQYRIDYRFVITSHSTATIPNVAITDPTIIWDTAIPAGGILPAGFTALGHILVPNTTASPYINTAQLTVAGTVVDTDTASAALTSSGLSITNLLIVQTAGTPPVTLPAFLTGRQGRISFTITNVGTSSVPAVGYTVALGLPTGSTNLTSCMPTGTTTLASGATINVTCTYTPPAGLNYVDNTTPADGTLDVPVTVTATGTGVTNVIATGPMNIVDLALDVTLTLNPTLLNQPPASTDVTYQVTLTNNGRSPIGCGAGVTSAYCHLDLNAQGTDPALQTVLDQIMADATCDMANTVLLPGVPKTCSQVRTVPSGGAGATHTIVATGGYWQTGLTPNDQYYTVQDTGTATLSSGGLAVENLQVRQVVGGTARTLLQTGLPVTISFTLHNLGSVAVANPTYTVDVGVTGGTCARTVPTTMPTTLAASGTLDITCTYTPPVSGAGGTPYADANGLNRTVTVTASGDAGVTAPAVTAPMTLIDLRLNVDLAVTPVPPASINLTDGNTANDAVTYLLTVTNAGLSPIGCDGTVAAAAACHLRLTGSSVVTGTTTPADATWFNTWLSGAAIANVVLQPGTGASATFRYPALDASPHTPVITTGQMPASTTYTVSVIGGYVTPAAANTYLTAAAAVDTATLLVTDNRPAIDIVSITPSSLTPAMNSLISYTITVQNTGSVPLMNLTGTWTILAGTASVPGTEGIVLASARRQATSGTLTFGVTSLAAGATTSVIIQRTETNTAAYRFSVTVNATTTTGTIQTVTDTTQVIITPQAGGTTTGTVTATLNPLAVDPIITKTAASADAQVGGAVVWTITIRNGGTAAMSSVTMRDAVPDTLSIGSATTTVGSSTVDAQLVTVTTGALNPGDTVTVTVNTSVDTELTAPAVITNNACAAREGGPTICAAGTVNVAPGSDVLPTTGIRAASHSGPRGEGLLGVALVGALMLLMSAQVSNRRLVIAGALTLVVMAVIAGVVTLVLLPGDDNEDKTTQVVTATPENMVVAPATTTGSDSSPIPATTQPAATLENAIPFELPEVSNPTPYQVPAPIGPRYLMIPKLSSEFQVPIPIVQIPLIERTWDVSGLGNYIGWLEGTTWMDPAWGNTVLAAHVQLGTDTPGPFWGIDTLIPGDEIIIAEGDVQHRFVVASVAPVEPTDWSVTAPTNGPTLTLITCTNWDDAAGVFSQRMVVRAVPVQS